MKLGFKKTNPLIAVFCLLSASASLHAFTPPEGYQGRFLVPRTLAIQPGFENNITQQEGLRICFYELEVDVRNCQHAFQNNVAGYNECIIMAGESHTSCLTWMQKLPVEENSN